jgi:hypothetical protein
VKEGTSTWRSPATSPYATWNNIPHNYGLVVNYGGLLGDICQYLGETDAALVGYRMPVPGEFGVAKGNIGWSTEAPNEDGWMKGNGSYVETLTAGYADGRADLFATQQGAGYDPDQPTNGAGMKFGSNINQAMGVVLPAAGFRGWISPTPRLMHTGAVGAYLQRPARPQYLHNFQDNASSSNVPVIMDANTILAYSVRCIRKLPGE